ncbi:MULTISPECIES: CdaR family protein [Streptomyces violaceusniger group]|uniref:CdaR GGDEF-like domain-containing protein n=2 Tax=Streptomyces rhizosphaericus TaxID=114699 RepID=A0ABN1S039_9ACTN|nr:MULTISPECIES: hypothetical protein [Streptomyces violaceusniger group]
MSRAATGPGLRILPALCAETAVLVAQGAPGERSLHAALSRELGTGSGAIGVGGSCGTPHEVPRSYQEALRALEVRRRSHSPYGHTDLVETLCAYFDRGGKIMRSGPE